MSQDAAARTPDAAAVQRPQSDADAGRVNRRAIRLMVAAMTCFIVNDALVKFVSQSLPAGQLIALRGLMSCALVLAVVRASRVPLRRQQLANRWVALRALIDALGTLTYLISLFHLPIANAIAINMATPLVITLLAALWLGARVSAARGVAIGAGFAGVLLIIQPSAAGFNGYAWLCLLATLLHALRDLSTLRIGRDVPSLAVTFATAVAVTIAAGVLSLAQGWVPIDGRQLALLAAAAVFLSAGYLLLIRSTRAGDPAVVAPFRYSGLLVAVTLGWLIWGDVPNALAWAGIALLIAAGLYLLRTRQG